MDHLRTDSMQRQPEPLPVADGASPGHEAQLRWEMAALNRLHELSARVVAAPDLRGVLRETMDAAIQLLGADFGSTQLYDPATNSLTLVAHRGFKPEVADHYQTVTLEDSSACGLALRNGPRIILEDMLDDARCEAEAPIVRIGGWRGVQSTPLRSRDGRLLAMVSTHWRQKHRPTERELRILDLYVRQATDVIERMQAQEALRESEQRFAAIFNQAAGGIACADPSGRFTMVNDRYCQIVGRRREELLGLHIYDITHPDDVPANAALLERVLKEQKAVTFDKRYIRPDGSIVWASVDIALTVDAQGRPLATIAVCQDITDRKQNEAMLEQRVARRTAELLEHQRRLQRLTVELTRTEQAERRRLANLLHDHLQQLLVAAKMRAEQARGKAQLQRVKDPLDACADLLRQSIEASRSLTAQLSPPVLYDAGLAPALAWLARWMQDNHDLTVGLDLDPAAEPQAEDVRVMLFEATRELLFNIAKHAGVDEAAVSMAREGEDRVKLTIADLGRGFDGQALEAAGDQRGIGLLHTRERLRYIGGDMIITSSPGDGTRIDLLAPLVLPHDLESHDAAPVATSASTDVVIARPKATSKPVAPDAGGKRIRVLIADDHQIMRQGLTSLLIDDPDIEVVGEAADGEAAVEMSQKLQPDVVIMDITMPRLNGVEATRRIKRTRPDVRVIGLSMHDATDMAASLREAGAAAYLTKGGPSEALVSAIKVK